MEIHFIAYGTNIKTSELAKAFPEVKILGYTYLNNYALEFVGYDGHAIATLSKKRGAKTPVAVWDFPEELRYTIANYEPFPYLYKKKKVSVKIGKNKLYGYIYLNKQKLRHGKPSEDYLQVLRDGYKEAGFDEKLIDTALAEQPKD